MARRTPPTPPPGATLQHLLDQCGLSLGEIVDALERNNVAVGGGWIERGAEQQVVRGESLLRDLDDMEQPMVA